MFSFLQAQLTTANNRKKCQEVNTATTSSQRHLQLGSLSEVFGSRRTTVDHGRQETPASDLSAVVFCFSIFVACCRLSDGGKEKKNKAAMKRERVSPPLRLFSSFPPSESLGQAIFFVFCFSILLSFFFKF